MHEYRELPEHYVNYIESNIEKAIDNFYKDWERQQKEYDALPWYKKWFKDDPFYGATKERLDKELCISNGTVFFTQSMEEDKLLAIRDYFNGYCPNMSLDYDDYHLVNWWANDDNE